MSVIINKSIDEQVVELIQQPFSILAKRTMLMVKKFYIHLLQKQLSKLVRIKEEHSLRMN